MLGRLCILVKYNLCICGIDSWNIWRCVTTGIFIDDPKWQEYKNTLNVVPMAWGNGFVVGKLLNILQIKQYSGGWWVSGIL